MQACRYLLYSFVFCSLKKNALKHDVSFSGRLAHCPRRPSYRFNGLLFVYNFCQFRCCTDINVSYIIQLTLSMVVVSAALPHVSCPKLDKGIIICIWGGGVFSSDDVIRIRYEPCRWLAPYLHSKLCKSQEKCIDTNPDWRSSMITRLSLLPRNWQPSTVFLNPKWLHPDGTSNPVWRVFFSHLEVTAHGFCLQSRVCARLIAAWLTDFLFSHPKITISGPVWYCSVFVPCYGTRILSDFIGGILSRCTEYMYYQLFRSIPFLYFMTQLLY